MIASEVETAVIAWVQAREPLFTQHGALTRRTRLVSGGWIDSLGVQELAAWIEQAYGVRLTVAETLLDALDSVDSIVTRIERDR